MPPGPGDGMAGAGGGGGDGTAGADGTVGTGFMPGGPGDSSVEAPPPSRAIRRLRESRVDLSSDDLDPPSDTAGAGGGQPDSTTLRSGLMYFSSALTLLGGGSDE